MEVQIPRNLYSEVSAQSAVRASEGVFWRRDHTSYPVEYRVTPVTGNDAPRGVVLWFRDITKRKQAESALLRKNRELIEALEKRKAAEAQAIQSERSSMNYAQRLKAMSRRIIDVQESEQRRLGRDLHDSASSNLAAIGLELRAIEKQLPETSLAKVGAQLSDCLELVKASMEIVHNISFALHSPVLDRLGLLPALEDFADRFEKRTKFAVVVTGHSERRLPADKGIALFRIAQEALTNCAKHSGARNASIKLAFDGDRITLSIEDDGRGFELLTVTQGMQGQGLGILSMRERVEAIGGEFHIASALGKGTKVVVHTPYSKAVDSSDYVI